MVQTLSFPALPFTITLLLTQTLTTPEISRTGVPSLHFRLSDATGVVRLVRGAVGSSSACGISESRAYEAR